MNSFHQSVVDCKFSEMKLSFKVSSSQILSDKLSIPFDLTIMFGHLELACEVSSSDILPELNFSNIDVFSHFFIVLRSPSIEILLPFTAAY